MLRLVRKANQGIKIGKDIQINVLEISKNGVQLGIDAPGLEIKRLDLCLSDASLASTQKPKKGPNIRVNLSNEILKQNEQAAMASKSENIGILEKFMRLFRLKKYLLS